MNYRVTSATFVSIFGRSLELEESLRRNKLLSALYNFSGNTNHSKRFALKACSNLLQLQRARAEVSPTVQCFSSCPESASFSGR